MLDSIPRATKARPPETEQVGGVQDTFKYTILPSQYLIKIQRESQGGFEVSRFQGILTEHITS